jgi:hypothetical protein
MRCHTCARAASGNVTTLPSPAMNSRHLMDDPPRCNGAYRGKGCKGTGFPLKPGLPHCISPEVCCTAPNGPTIDGFFRRF